MKFTDRKFDYPNSQAQNVSLFHKQYKSFLAPIILKNLKKIDINSKFSKNYWKISNSKEKFQQK